MDTVAQMKAEAAELPVGKGSWRENHERLIWCGQKEGGGFVFYNTTSATARGPKISEADAARYLASEGPWRRPEKLTHAA